MKILGTIFFILAFGLISAQVSAVPIHYVESIDGPLNPDNPLILGVGTNIVEGSDCWTSTPVCLSTADFSFTLQSGTELVNYRYIFGNLVVAADAPTFWTGALTLRGLDDPSLIVHTNVGNWLTGTLQTLSANDLNWSDGTYRQFYSAGRDGKGGTWDFRIELDVISAVTDIPLPATILFFGFGLGLAGFVRRRSSAA